MGQEHGRLAKQSIKFAGFLPRSSLLGLNSVVFDLKRFLEAFIYSPSICIYVNEMQRHPSSQRQRQSTLRLCFSLMFALHVSPRDRTSAFFL